MLLILVRTPMNIFSRLIWPKYRRSFVVLRPYIHTVLDSREYGEPGMECSLIARTIRRMKVHPEQSTAFHRLYNQTLAIAGNCIFSSIRVKAGATDEREIRLTICCIASNIGEKASQPIVLPSFILARAADLWFGQPVAMKIVFLHNYRIKKGRNKNITSTTSSFSCDNYKDRGL